MFLLEFRQSILVSELNFVVSHLFISLMYIVLFFAKWVFSFESMKFVLLSHDREINVQDNRNQMGEILWSLSRCEIACRQAKKTSLLSHTCIME